MFNTNEPPPGKYPAYAYKSWRKADGELDAKPLTQWVMEFELLQNHLIHPEPFEEMDWEKTFFFHSLLSAKADRERKAHEEAAKKAKEEMAKYRRGRR